MVSEAAQSCRRPGGEFQMLDLVLNVRWQCDLPYLCCWYMSPYNMKRPCGHVTAVCKESLPCRHSICVSGYASSDHSIQHDQCVTKQRSGENKTWKWLFATHPQGGSAYGKRRECHALLTEIYGVERTASTDPGLRAPVQVPVVG